MQIAWLRNAGRYTIQANYTLQKALGIVSSTLNPFNLHANYGAQPTDRRQLFNIAYSLDLGSPLHANKFLNGAVNGWQLSGITQVQSGANLTYSGSYNASTNFNLNVGNLTLPGTTIGINNQSILGTNAIQLNPLVLCNPKSGLGPHQYINPNCFAPPTVVGQNGPNVLPAVYGPSFFDSDLALFKNFKIRESMNLQFRFNAYNFLNHPLWSFPDNSNLTLKYDQDASGKITLDSTSSKFGTATTKQGARILELAVKFSF
jgi:hypothetical protein